MERRHTFQVDVVIVEDGLAPKRGTILLRMVKLLITAGLSAELFVECVLWPEDWLDEAVPAVHVLVLVDLLAEKESELIVRRLVEFSTKI